MPIMKIETSYHENSGRSHSKTVLEVNVDSLKSYDYLVSDIDEAVNREDVVSDSEEISSANLKEVRLGAELGMGRIEPTVVKEENYSPLAQELQHVLNKYSAESVSGTPDFILAEFVLDSLKAYNAAVVKRADWRGEMAEFRPSPKENWLNTKP